MLRWHKRGYQTFLSKVLLGVFLSFWIFNLLVIAQLNLIIPLRNIPYDVPHESFTLHKVHPIQGLTCLLQQQFLFDVLFKHVCVFIYSLADPFWVMGCLMPWIFQQRNDFLLVMTIHKWIESNVFFKLWGFMHKYTHTHFTRKNICAIDIQMPVKIM